MNGAVRYGLTVGPYCAVLASVEVQALALVLVGQVWLSAMEDPPDPEKPPEVLLYLVPSRPNGL